MREKWTELPRRLWALAGRYQYVLLVLAAGVLLLMLPSGGGEEAEPAGAAAETEPFDLEGFEEKLAAALSRVQGAGTPRCACGWWRRCPPSPAWAATGSRCAGGSPEPARRPGREQKTGAGARQIKFGSERYSNLKSQEE